MAGETFIIKSLFIQNSIMLISLGVVLAFLAAGIVKKRPKLAAAAVIWTGIVLWFFNSAYFGFSVVTVGPEGICLKYGVLSARDVCLPIDSPWEIATRFSDIKKMKKVYLITIGGRDSMRVKGAEGRVLLERIGKAIEDAKAGSSLMSDKRPVRVRTDRIGQEKGLLFIPDMADLLLGVAQLATVSESG
ncbi:MAG: hypothetical protein J7M32_04825 [Deltaproteobacteria bacterium]|nr:hypothetical protein [Deltaproteobacteria bacterium]